MGCICKKIDNANIDENIDIQEKHGEPRLPSLILIESKTEISILNGRPYKDSDKGRETKTTIRVNETTNSDLVDMLLLNKF